MSAPEFWQNRAQADELMKELGELQDILNQLENLEKAVAELRSAPDENKLQKLKKDFRALELKTLFAGPHDKGGAILSIYPGVGGEDAEDWARMLFRMYEYYAKRQGWSFRELDDNPRSRTAEISAKGGSASGGSYIYGYLKGEAGVHRLVRISPFSAKSLRHTSFALVEVLPDLPKVDADALDIPEKDLKVEFSRAGGPGGQNVNKVETAVRIVHLPTGLAVAARAERSQSQNREKALSMLKAKLLTLMEKTQAKELGDLRSAAKPEWGSQIRSYVLNPYQLVKDHRTEVEKGNVEAVLNRGEIDEFIEAEVETLGNKA